MNLYLHIPFCKTRCIYCAFYSTTFDTLKDKYIAAMRREIGIRLGKAPVSTLYLGGGTPSQLSIDQLATLLKDINIRQDAERTIECNPDDITADYAQGLRRLGFNRVSLGMQTFDDGLLKFIHRRHNAKKAMSSIAMLHDAGFENISLDLMYGLPGQTLSMWESDIDTALSLGVKHISCYCLTFEEDTPLYNMRENGEVKEIDDETALQMYNILIDKLKSAGFEHYEISNFAIPGFRSHHNTGYWNGTPYIGIGAGAHSYDGKSRRWNICDVKSYIKLMQSNTDKKAVEAISEGEELSNTDRYNELVMTRLRTSDGLPLAEIPSAKKQQFLKSIEKFIQEGNLCIEDNTCRLTRQGLFISDYIISSLFI